MSLALLAAASSAPAATFFKGFAEPMFVEGNASERALWLDRSAEANSNIARININWAHVLQGQPTLPGNPADPVYRLESVDQAVIDAAARGHEILITIFHAPAFAEGPNRPPQDNDRPAGSWKPDPTALGQFAEALATRYSGNFPSPSGMLPRVNYFEPWNEPNLPDYLSPQSNGIGDHYRSMVNAFSAGVARSQNPGANVIAGATAPYGDRPSGPRTQPLVFLREFLCLNNKQKPKPCPDKADFDILSHHPISIDGGPNHSAVDPNNVAMADFKFIVRFMRAAEKGNTVLGGRHPTWATEYWWETKPPDKQYGVPLQKHARFVQEAMYSLWRHGADAALWLQLVDHAIAPDGVGGNQTGMFFVDGTQKPAFEAYRFPFVADRTSKKKVNFWTIAPADGTVEIQAKKRGGFKTIDRMSVRDGVPEQTKVKLEGKPKVRGLLNDEYSIRSKPG